MRIQQNVSVIVCLLMLGVMTTIPAQAKQDGASEINKHMVQRAERFCDAVLPKWLASEAGMRDPSVRDVTAKCYINQVRLSVFGVASKFAPSDIDIVEVPAMLLSRKAGISLDIFKPLAGAELQLRRGGN